MLVLDTQDVRKSTIPLNSADDRNAAQPNAEIGVNEGTDWERAGEESRQRVAGRSERVAT